MKGMKTKNKNAITLIALVITIVIMLLLAAIAIQLTLGENGLIVKANQTKAEQAKAELYDTAKLEYLNLKTKAVTNNQPEPKAEAVLSETNFLSKYNIVDDNITNKNNEIIETKENLFKILSDINETSEYTISIPNEDKDKFIFKVKVQESAQFSIELPPNTFIDATIESYDGSSQTFEGAWGTLISKTLSTGEYTFKIAFLNSNASAIDLIIDLNSISGLSHIDILNWRKFTYCRK